MKKTLKGFFVSTLMVLVCLTLVGCVIDRGGDVVNQKTIGDDYPEKVNAPYKINATMSALEMYQVGVKNFNQMEFVATHQLGNITTTSVAGTMTQKLDCLRIKQDNKVYLDSNSFSTSGPSILDIRMCDQSIYDYKTGVYTMRSADKSKIKIIDGKLVVTEWPEIEKFSSLSEGLREYPDNPTKMNMFIVNADTIRSSTKPLYDAKNRTYKFDLVLDNNSATTDYIEVMKYKSSKGGLKTNKIKFTKLKLSVVMWDNGLIKSIANDEAYTIDFLGENKTKLLATTYFTYDKTEANINNYLFN